MRALYTTARFYAIVTPVTPHELTDTSKIRLISFFAALCLFLSAVEYAIPKPLPFMRLGLANLPILLSLSKMRRRDTLLLVVLKVLGQALLSGTLFSYIFVYSAAGTFASALVMLAVYFLFYRTRAVSYIGISLAGALANNGVQLLLTQVMLFGTNTRYVAPILIITGLVTGTALGVFANMFVGQSRWFASLPDTYPFTAVPSVNTADSPEAAE